MADLRKVVLDVLKPHEPNITVLAQRLSELEGVDGVNVSVYELDQKVENVKATIMGSFPDLSAIREIIIDIGGSVHSIDEVVAGKKIINEEETLQERERDQP